MKIFILFFIGRLLSQGIPLGQDSFYDSTHDYSQFKGRITDKDKTGKIYKIWSQNGNVKFLKTGDMVEFRLNQGGIGKDCKGHVRHSEEFYFVIYVEFLDICWPKGRYLPRGSLLSFYSINLWKRIVDAGLFRQTLIEKRKDNLKQLNRVNNFLNSYVQQKVKIGRVLDEIVLKAEEAKQRGLDRLEGKKREFVVLQGKLKREFDRLEYDINFYRISPIPEVYDVWQRDSLLPLEKYPTKPENRPVRIGERSQRSDKLPRRWDHLVD